MTPQMFCAPDANDDKPLLEATFARDLRNNVGNVVAAILAACDTEQLAAADPLAMALADQLGLFEGRDDREMNTLAQLFCLKALAAVPDLLGTIVRRYEEALRQRVPVAVSIERTTGLRAAA